MGRSVSGHASTGAVLALFGSLIARVALADAATISGTVEAQGVGLANELVVLKALDAGTFDSFAMTGEDGTYQFTDLPPGHYGVCVLEDSDVFLNQCYPGSDVPASGELDYQPLDASSGQTLTGIDFALNPGVTVSGVLRDAETNAPLGGRSGIITLYSSGQQIVAQPSITTGADGAYVIGGVAPGNYYLEAFLAYVFFTPNSYYRSGLFGGGSCTSPQHGCPFAPPNVLEVAPSTGAVAVDVALAPGHHVKGKVTDIQSGFGVGGITVQTCEPGIGGFFFDITAQTVTASDGSYDLGHVIGNSPHLYSYNGHGYFDVAWPDTIVSIITNCDSLDGDALSFAGLDDTLAGIDLSLPTGASISGRVTAVEAPDAGIRATVEVFRDDGASLSTVWRGKSDADGYYESNGLGEGTYYVRARIPVVPDLCQEYGGQACNGFVGATPIIIDSVIIHSGIDLQLSVDIFNDGFD